MGDVANPVASLIRTTVSWSFFLSILLILAGFFTLMLPFIGGIGVAIFVGWALIVSGVTHLVLAWKSHVTGHRIWEFLVGLAYLVAGIYMILHPLSGLASLTLLLAFYLFFEGIFEVIAFFQIRPRHGAVWLLVDGAITLLLAWMIWRHWPSSSLWAIGTLVGISMLFSGFSRLMLALSAKRVLRTV